MVEVIIKEFNGFEESDFDAYRPEKWRSNRFNLERMRITQKLAALGAAMVREGPLGELDRGTSDDHPCHRNAHRVDHQLLYFLRPEAARRDLEPYIHRARPMSLMVADPATHHQHLYLGVKIDLSGVQVGMFLHGHALVDHRNVQALMADPTRSDDLAAAVAALGDGWELIPPSGDERPVAGLSSAALDASVRQMSQPTSCLCLSRRLGREEVEAMGPGFLDEARSLLERLLPLYHVVAWAPDNDLFGLATEREEEARRLAEAKARSEAEAKRKEEERRRRQEEAERRAREQEEDRRILRELQRKALAARRKAAQEDGGEARQPAQGDQGREPQPIAAPRPRLERGAGSREEPRKEWPGRGREHGRGRREQRPGRAARATGQPERAPREPREPRKAREPRQRSQWRGPKSTKRDEPTLAAGDKVRMERGLMAGKVGVVKALDERGGVVTVEVLGLTVRVAPADIKKVRHD